MALPALGASWRVEAEPPEPWTDARWTWETAKSDQASGGAYRIGRRGGSPALDITLPKAGTYWVWVRYQRGKDDHYGAFLTLVRDSQGAGIGVQYMDRITPLDTERPYEKTVSAIRQGTKPGDWLWEKMEVQVVHPIQGTLRFTPISRTGGRSIAAHIDCAIITDEAAFDPNHADWRAIPTFAENPPKLEPSPVPKGMKPAAGFVMEPSFFAGIDDRAKQFTAASSTNFFLDEPSLLTLGFNRNMKLGRLNWPHAKLPTMWGSYEHERLDDETAKKYPSPQGRFMNAQGQASKRTWSFFFKPLQENVLERTRKAIAPALNQSAIEKIAIAHEGSGHLDYSESAREAWPLWLKDRYQTIDNLNGLWRTKHASFEEVELPKSADEGKAAWFEFFRFNSTAYCDAVQRTAQAVREIAPDMPMVQQLSNGFLLGAKTASRRPLDIEQFINVALKGVDTIGMDIYAADDFLGAEVDLLNSLADGRKVVNEEWNVHAADERIAGRTYWTMVGKGHKGIYAMAWQNGLSWESSAKWSFANSDGTPKAKFGAVVDAVQEVHRLERILMPANLQNPVKPVALYYSRLDLAVSKPMPLGEGWFEPIDTPFRIYSILRGMGYPIRWITPKQIEEGQLADVSAVVLVDAQHIPRQAARKLADWIHQGGAVIADTWPGAYDEHGQPQDTLDKVFGVRAKNVAKNKAAGELAWDVSIQGYGEITISAMLSQGLPFTVGEIYQQWDATHPVAREVGNYTLSGYGLQEIECTSGHVIASTFGGGPGIVLNQHGKGHTLYVGMMLGSLYESSATRYEWDTTHSGTGYSRLMDAFLRFAGVEPSAVAELPLRERAKLRVETPLVDARGNALFAMQSFNDRPMDAFGLTLRWPEGLAAPRMVLMAVNGNRRLAPLPFTLVDGKLKLTTVPFVSHATILALTDSDPMVAVDYTGVERAASGLLAVNPGDRLRATVTVYNPSPKALKAGQVKLWAPQGWFNDAAEKKCPAIKPWGQAQVTFTIQAPATGSPSSLLPLVVRHVSDGQTSTPATEQVWWNRPADRMDHH